MSMDIYHKDAIYSIDFHMPLSSRAILQQLGFVYLLEVKFNAERKDVSRHWTGNGKEVGHIELEFDYKTYPEAKDHCRNNLTATGKVLTRYKGALDQADRNGREARALLMEMKASEPTNAGP